MTRLDKIGKSAEQLDYERDQAQLASESIFEAKLAPAFTTQPMPFAGKLSRSASLSASKASSS